LVLSLTIQGLKKRIVFALVNHVYVGTRCFEKKRRLLNSIGIEIGEGSKVVAPIFCTGTLKVGRDVWVGKNLIVNGNGTVVIGDNCDIAPEVTFLTGGHEIGDASRRAGKGEKYRIEIGNGTWIGCRSTILGNAKVGSGVVIASCACVVKSVPDHVLVGGVPASIIENLD